MKSHRTLFVYATTGTLAACALLWAGVDRAPQTCHLQPPVVRAATPAPQARAQVGETLRLTAALDRGYIAQGQRGSTAHLVVDVDAMAKPSVRAPLDVAIVIDRSSSMVSDHKLESAKLAAAELIRNLRPGDRATVVTYSTHVDVAAPLTTVRSALDRARLLDAITRIRASGGTNISAGLKAAYNVLAHDTSPERVRRVILLSDGHATTGMTTTPELSRLSAMANKGGVSVTSVGLGLEFNELLMTELANQGGGNYYFVPRGRHLSGTFAQEFEHLNTTVARDTVLSIKLAPGVRATDLGGVAHHLDAGVLRIPLAELHAGENRSVVVGLKLPHADAVGTLPVASVDVAYRDLAAKQARRHEASLRASVTDDPRLIAASVHHDVRLRVERTKTARAVDEAMRTYEGGDASTAARVLDTRLKALGGIKGAPATDLEQIRQARESIRSHRYDSDAGKRALKRNRSWSFDVKRRR